MPRTIIHIFKLLLFAVISPLCAGCIETEEFRDTPQGNFDALCEIVDSRYCFFEEKDLDWRVISANYRQHVRSDMSQLELFNLCAAMLNCLQDGHVNLSSRFDTSYYRRWWSDYPQDFNLRTLQQYYLDFDYMSTSGIIFKRLDDGHTGYIYYPSFGNRVSETALDYILAYLKDCKALIIDIRDNGGGLLLNIDTFVGRFIEREIQGGFVCHKTGPGHDDFSKPYPITYKAADPQKHIKYSGPIALLTNRSSYSAANAFTAVMKSLPQTVVIGARTGGGGGMPMSYEMPNGWLVRLSASPLYGPGGEYIEGGIEPSKGFECHSPEEELALGRDAILDRALEYCRSFH